MPDMYLMWLIHFMRQHFAIFYINISASDKEYFSDNIKLERFCNKLPIKKPKAFLTVFGPLLLYYG
jgi:hypothetical protein